MRAVDTNVLVRVLTRDDAAQATIADQFIEPGAWVSHLVLCETLWVLEAVYGLKHKELSVTIAMLLSHTSLVIEDRDLVERALVAYGTQTKVDFADLLILEEAKRAGHTPLGTFDRALGKLRGAQRLS